MICAHVCVQEARLAECERMLVAMDLAMWLNDGSATLQAVASCYGLLAPLIFHQITCDPVVQVCNTSSISVSTFCPTSYKLTLLTTSHNRAVNNS